MIEKKFGIDFFSDGGALTLNPDCVTDSGTHIGMSVKIHASGWTIRGCVVCDYSAWVNEFVATHPQYGCVFGNFEKTVFADNEEGYCHFYKYHPPFAWDYQDQ